MYRNHPEVQDFLERGGTLVVPTRQRAAAVQLAYTAASLHAGAQTWNSPDVLHWHAWQGRRLDVLRNPDAAALRRLASVEDWFLWREALEGTREAYSLLQTDGLLDELRRAAELVDAWGLPAAGGPGVEAMLLLQLRRRLEARRAQLRIADPLGWRAAPPEPGQDVWCLGFDAVGRADRSVLQELGVRIAGPHEDGRRALPDATPRTVMAADPDAEARLVADWCRQRLQRDPQARLLVLTPKLRLYDTALRQALGERLDGDSILQGGAADSLFAIEGGRPLLQFPLVTAARSWLRSVCGRVEFAECSALLRSGYFAAGGVVARTRLEEWLREQNVTALHPDDLPRLLPRAADALGAEAVVPLARLQQLQAQRGGRESPAAWAQRWVQWLQVAGWPGAIGLGSREQQVRQRFETLLGEFAQLGDLAGGCTLEGALQIFDAWLQRASFEPASGDLPVTVSGDVGDPLIRYDGIWICGLTAQDWPQGAISNPFVSLPGLLAAGCEAGTATGALRRAEAAMQAWKRCADELVYSWPRQIGDAELQPSPLLPAALDPGDANPLQPADSPWRGEQFPPERYGLQAAQPWPAGQHAAGGVRVLEDQSLCPFRGFALGRLHSDTLAAPRAGLSAQTHGIVLHDALQQIWTALGDSATLRARQEGLPGLVREAVAGALRRAQDRQVLRLPAPLWEIEADRCLRLISNQLQTELQRSDFAVVAVERLQEFQAHGVALRFKIDRLDQIPGAGHVLIDYKSGKARRFDPLAERPASPQLLAYASSLDVALCAVASAHLNVAGATWRGAADSANRLPRVRPAGLPNGGWTGLLQRWRAQIDGLLAEFAAGEARVDPLPTACERCHLSGLCRIAENDLALNEAAADGDDDSGDAP